VTSDFWIGVCARVSTHRCRPDKPPRGARAFGSSRPLCWARPILTKRVSSAGGRTPAKNHTKIPQKPLPSPMPPGPPSAPATLHDISWVPRIGALHTERLKVCHTFRLYEWGKRTRGKKNYGYATSLPGSQPPATVAARKQQVVPTASA